MRFVFIGIGLTGGHMGAKRIVARGASTVASVATAENSDLCRSLVRDMPAMVHSIDASGAIVDVSQRWLEILGYSRSEVIGRRSTEFLTEESQAYAIENVLPEFFRTGRCVDIPYQVIARDGRVLDVLLSATCVRGDDGQVLRSIAVMQDVTARKRAERKLDAAKAYAENLLHTANVMVVELDCEGGVRRLNQAAETIAGYTSADLRGRNWFQLVSPPAVYPDVRAAMQRLILSGTDDPFESTILTRDGRERRIVWRNSQVIEDGKVRGTLSVGVDVTEQRSIEQHLLQSEQALREAQAVAQIGSWTLDYQTGDLHWSSEIFRILGLDPDHVLPSKAAFLSVLHPEDRDLLARTYRQALVSRSPYDIRYRLLLGDGTLKYVHQRTRIDFSPLGTPLRDLGTLQDVTMTVLQEMALQESEERFRTIADFTYDWEYWQGARREILFVSPSCKRVTGYSQTDFIRDPGLLLRIVHPDDRALYEAHKCDFECARDLQIEFRILTKDGQERWIAHGCRPVFDKNGRQNGRRVSNRDITSLKSAELMAHKLAYFDALTELPNRRLLMDRLVTSIPLAKRRQLPLALMFVDLDRFKAINDTFGHDVGDQLLVEVGRRFKTCLRASDTVARTGGDEFIVLLPDLAAAADADAVAEKLLGALRAPVVCATSSFEISASIGIALLLPGAQDDSSELMKKADIAMYAAKQAGRNRYRRYDG